MSTSDDRERGVAFMGTTSGSMEFEAVTISLLDFLLLVGIAERAQAYGPLEQLTVARFGREARLLLGSLRKDLGVDDEH
jgi:hypothetical protein